MDVVPNRDLYDFYRKSRFKGEKVENGVNDVTILKMKKLE